MAKRKKRVYSEEQKNDVKNAFMAGGGLRQVAGLMDIPVGTITTWAQDGGWTSERKRALEILPEPENPATKIIEQYDQRIAEIEAKAAEKTRAEVAKTEATREELVEKFESVMRGAVDLISDQITEMTPDQLSKQIRNLDVYDRLSRRVLGIEKEDQSQSSHINLAILNHTGGGDPDPMILES